MHEYAARIRWTCEGDFARGRYSRAHDWTFDGGAVIRASTSPLSVPLPFSDATAIDPEEAFVAAVASCHMLWFLDLARQAGLQAATYRDAAVGHMEGSPHPWITRVDLHPEALWTGAVPEPGKIRELHHSAHERCFIANSIRSDVMIHLPQGFA